MAKYGSGSSNVGSKGSIGKSQHIKGRGCSTPVVKQIPRGKLSK